MNTYMILRKHFGLLVVVLFLVSCGSDDSGDNTKDSFDRKTMLTNIADNVIVPAYDSLSVATQELLNLTQALNELSSGGQLEKIGRAHV